SLSVLTSFNRGTLINQPFRTPQMHMYIKHVCKITTCYLAMILRSTTHDLPGFPIFLSPEQKLACLRLRQEATSGRDLLQPLYELGWALLSINPSEMMVNDRL